MRAINKKIVFLIVAGLTVASCARGPNVELSNKFWNNKKQTVVLARSIDTRIGLIQGGHTGLLDDAISKIVMHRFDKFINHMRMDWLFAFQSRIAARIRSHGIKVIDEHRFINSKKLKRSHQDKKKYGMHNYSVLYGRFGKDKLLVIGINELGAYRRYYSFIPLGKPKALVSLTGRMIDLKTNRILWRHSVKIVQNVTGAWDQPPNYPNFMRAEKAAISAAVNELLASLETNA